MTVAEAALRHALAEGAAAMDVPLGDEQLDRMLAFRALLSKWNGVYNLTAVRDPSAMVTQHLLDSLAAAPAFVGAASVLDVGAGGGLPGIVLAIWSAGAQPAMRWTLIDTVRKKTAFLMQAKSELGLSNLDVQTGRVEAWRPARRFDVITSRAFAELADFVRWSAHLLAEGGRFVAMKGMAPEREISALPAGWTVREVRPLTVPGLEAQRHVVIIERGAT
ncbi:MAG: 16S rRNA (guanine(527)-N(7))-methyltransferase RsmG [Burkholderiaceae bacterium]